MKNDDLEQFCTNFIKKFELNRDDAQSVEKNAFAKITNKDEIIYQNSDNCFGYVMIKSGILRAYIMSENGKEITIFTLKSSDECIMCANCAMYNLTLEVILKLQKGSEILVIPAQIYSNFKNKYPKLASHTINLISHRFSQVINVLEQTAFLPLTERVRRFLLDMNMTGSVKFTHEEIVNHIGSAREAVSRVLKDMEKNGEISCSRGVILLKK